MQSFRGVPEDYDPEGYWYKGWSPFFDPPQGRPGYGLKGRGAHVGYETARRAAVRARRAENQFAVQLRRLAGHIEHIVQGLWHPEDPGSLQRIQLALADYSRTIVAPWAQRAAARMLADVLRRDAKGWHELGQKISEGLEDMISDVSMAHTLRDLLQEQVDLITSLPTDISAEVHELSLEAMTSGRRWEDLVPYIQERLIKTGGNAKARANTIARTETARATTEIQATRAQGIGSEGFIWRTAKDRDVRELHKKFEGKYYRWTDPPILDDGRPGLPGTIWNCRCFPEIVLPGVTPKLNRPRNPAYLAALRAQGYTTGTAFE